MKKLDWTAVTASNGLVFEEQTFEHINNGHKDSYIAFVKANIPSAWHTGKLVILYGCVDSGTHPARNLSAGAVYYNGEIYQVDSASFTTTGLQIGIWTLTDVDSGTDESTIKTATSSFAEHVLVNSKFVLLTCWLRFTVLPYTLLPLKRHCQNSHTPITDTPSPLTFT